LLLSVLTAAGCGIAELTSAGVGGATPIGRSAVGDLPSRSAAGVRAREGAGGSIIPGPVPDFEPVRAVVTHRQLVDIQPELSTVLTTLLGPQHLVERFSGPAPLVLTGRQPPGVDDESLLWVRDYQPIFVRTADGELKMVRYLAENPNRARYLPARGEASARPDGSYRYFDLPGTSRGGRWLRTEALPLIHENGNLVSSGKLVFLTDLIFDQNVEDLSEPHLRAAGYRPRSEAEVKRLLAKALERPQHQLVVLPSMPGEDTGHVDMYLLALDEHTMVIPEIRDEALDDEMLSEQTRGFVPAAQRFLEERAAELEALGLEVVRLPMLPPMAMTEEPAGDGEGTSEPGMLVLSPTNALLLPVVGARTVLLPYFDVSEFPLVFRRLDATYRRIWAERFRAHGWIPVTVEATQLALGQGLLRCASYPVPL
jgi:hypothetical protein